MGANPAFQQYFQVVQQSYRSGIASEHTYRPHLQQLLAGLLPSVIQVTNEPKRIACGAPDYILTRGDIPVGYIEAKDIGADLDGRSYVEQFDRYRSSLDNLIITDYLEFRFYRGGEFTTSVRIGEVNVDKIRPITSDFHRFEILISEFVAWNGQTISSPQKLSIMMAGKARLLADVIEKAVTSDESNRANTDLKDQLDAFKRVLIHDITPKAFADLYAQTIAYGMFAARIHDPSIETFTRFEASTLIPRSNPFLRKLFNTISGPDLDSRIVWIVDALADIFRATDVVKILSSFGKQSGREDAFMHFYEDFLKQYDSKLRDSRGIWYTPDAVVQFIVRATDDILKREFGLPMGLADSSTTQIEVETQVVDRRTSTGRRTEKRTVHRVQVLDPATGTGTFLAEVVRQVHAKFQGQEGMWPQYVEQHLIPRLNGFELLMASYAIAHLKLDMVLRESGYDLGSHSSERWGQQRLRVFLTNTLEEAHPDTGTLFATWLSEEANEANAVKRDTPVMVVLGNPPYKGISGNKGEWITKLINDYKYIDGVHFGEKKHWLGDDYKKFIRFGENFIERTGEGVLAYISSHGFLSDPTANGMRWHLAHTFDEIFVLDLHGNKKKKEICPDGSKDDNVFDIQDTGVSINLFIKTNRKPKDSLGRVWHADLWGSRSYKNEFLRKANRNEIKWSEVTLDGPKYFFYPKPSLAATSYDQLLDLKKLFNIGTSGVQTSRDFLVIDQSKESLVRRLKSFLAIEKSDADVRDEFFPSPRQLKYLKGDTRGWRLADVRPALRKLDLEELVIPYSYRPFDCQFISYSPHLVDWGREKVMRHLTAGPNVSITIGRQGQVVGSSQWSLVLVQNQVSDLNVFYRGGGEVFPLYLYPETTKQTEVISQGVRPNLDVHLVDRFAKGIGYTYCFDENDLWSNGTGTDLTTLDVLDYCYAVLHSPSYRTKYREFLKSDFPRIPYPTNSEKFRAVVKLGERLRLLHLLEHPLLDTFITKYPASGDNSITRKMTTKSLGYESLGNGLGNVWINEYQYFAGVPEDAWNFFIGGYQPAQKWLKDRYGRVLTIEEIRHYQRMIVALTETSKTMSEIDALGVEW